MIYLTDRFHPDTFTFAHGTKVDAWDSRGTSSGDVGRLKRITNFLCAARRLR